VSNITLYRGVTLKFKLDKNNTKKISKQKCKPSEDDSLQIPCDEDGKIVFVFKNNTPMWLIDELNKRFRCNKDRGPKCGALPV
jgi:hypothetical protein